MPDRMFLLASTMILGLLTSGIGADEVDVSYGGAPQQKLDIYSAVGGKGGELRPVVIWVHGGGWRNGDKDNRSGTNLCKTWANTGVVMVNLNYRLTPDVVHPVHVEDVAAGIAWVQKNIASRGGDPKKIHLLGHSAGAHLVALVATNPQYLSVHGLTPRAALAGVMPIDTASYDLTSTESPLVRRMIADAFGNDKETLASASPLLQAKSHRDACPPFIIAVAKQRPDAVRESVALSEALPKSQLIQMDYPRSGQLKAHGEIARDLSDPNNSMTRRLIAFVNDGK